MEHLLAVWNYVATHPFGVVMAIVASFLIGFLMHGPLFGPVWIKLNNITPPKPGEMKFSAMVPGFVASIVMPLFQVAVLGRTFQIVALTGMAQALLIAVIIWLPFTALVLANEYAWAGKSWKNIAFDAAYNLCSMLAIAAIAYATL